MAEPPPETTASPQRLLDRTEVAELLGVSARLVRKLTDERMIGVVRVGRLVRYEPGEVERYVASQRRPAAR